MQSLPGLPRSFATGHSLVVCLFVGRLGTVNVSFTETVRAGEPLFIVLLVRYGHRDALYRAISKTAPTDSHN